VKTEPELQIRINPAKPSDAESIADMSRRLIETGLPWSWTPRRVAGHIDSSNSVVITARTDNRLIGFAIMQFSDDAAHLNLLAVEPEYQRKGLGGSLLDWLEQSAIVAGVFFVSLEVRTDNLVAIRFYHDRGYVETGSMPKYYDRTDDATLFAHDLRTKQVEESS